MKKCETVRIVPKSNRKVVERGTIDIPYAQMHVCWLSWLGTINNVKI